MRYRQRVAIQASVEHRSASGGVSHTYENVEGLSDLPAFMATVAFDEQRQDRLMPTEQLRTCIVAGDHRQVTSDMALVSTEGVFDIVRVEPDDLDRSKTLLVIRQVAL